MGPDLERTEQQRLASTRARERIVTSILKLLPQPSEVFVRGEER